MGYNHYQCTQILTFSYVRILYFFKKKEEANEIICGFGAALKRGTKKAMLSTHFVLDSLNFYSHKTTLGKLQIRLRNVNRGVEHL